MSSHATPEKMSCTNFQQIPQYSCLTEFNIFNTTRRMSFRENSKIQKKDTCRRAYLLILGKILPKIDMYDTYFLIKKRKIQRNLIAGTDKINEFTFSLPVYYCYLLGF